MQLYALKNTGWILANEAFSQTDYQCPECRGTLRLRSGKLRQPHFYHLRKPAHCRQHGKSETHLSIQLALLQQLPKGEGHMECPFPKIGRIADVVWEKEGLVFEVQCSPISLNEARARNADYASIGLTPVWILHTRRFNRRFLSAAESYLRTGLCFYTSHTPKQPAFIYDQLDICNSAKRLFRSKTFPVHLGRPISIESSLTFAGSLLDKASRDPAFRSWLEQMKKSWSQRPQPALLTRIKQRYTSLLHLALEKLTS